MPDVVVTVPKSFGLSAWVSEGDAAGEPWSGTEWYFSIGRILPMMDAGERVYIVCNGRLRGYAPLVRIEMTVRGYALVRHGDAQAVTIPEVIRGFRGFRYRWWRQDIEVPFPDWRRA